MAGRIRNRERGLARPKPFRTPKHRILVVCEGKRTEPAYFKSLQHAFRNRLVHVEICDQHGVPMTLVEVAIEERKKAEREARNLRDENLRFDEVWCVCDVDEHPRLTEALQRATENDIKVALSNPCFELWALLHLREQSESLHRHEAQREVARLLSLKNDKHFSFDKLHPKYDTAVRRAIELRRQAAACEQPRRNPTTNVDELTERIRNP